MVLEVIYIKEKYICKITKNITIKITIINRFRSIAQLQYIDDDGVLTLYPTIKVNSNKPEVICKKILMERKEKYYDW